ncbi:MAG: hypothetical protein M1830_010258 [Pleopsidium flavum]|nr:MAG: hypothetical protein M1830_010258 [Pleopsidium flavum]
MTAVLSPSFLSTTPPQPRQIPQRPEVHLPSQLPPSISGVRSGHLNLDTFSPVNQNGSFAFDRVLKSGDVKKRTRKTKAWKKIHLVLRPNLISIYKDKNEGQLQRPIVLSDLTAVAPLKDPKREYVFGLYSPSRNYHLQAESEKDAQEWIDLIRREARIEEEEDEFLGSSHGGNAPSQASQLLTLNVVDTQGWQEEGLGSGSPEPIGAPKGVSTIRDGTDIPDIKRHPPHNFEFSGNELTSYSDTSDAPAPAAGFRGASSLSLSLSEGPGTLEQNIIPPTANDGVHSTTSTMAYNAGQSSGLQLDHDDERVVWHGFLRCLRSRGGVRQWKKLWVVLRPKNVAFYKNEEVPISITSH